MALGQDAVDRGGERFPRDRLNKIFIGAGFEGAVAIDAVIAPGDDDDLGALKLLPDGAANLEAVRLSA